jgi:hypothetical protein
MPPTTAMYAVVSPNDAMNCRLTRYSRVAPSAGPQIRPRPPTSAMTTIWSVMSPVSTLVGLMKVIQ